MGPPSLPGEKELLGLISSLFISHRRDPTDALKGLWCVSRRAHVDGLIKQARVELAGWIQKPRSTMSKLIYTASVAT